MSAPLRIMDLGRAFRAHSAGTAATDEPGQATSSSNNPALPLEVASFLTTSKGLQWFADVLAGEANSSAIAWTNQIWLACIGCSACQTGLFP